jgi:LDH2 family malate/lactate/ureidoglycolate dehydrogenase
VATTSPPRISHQELLACTTALLHASGLAPERAAVVADSFVATDLLGFHTHGLFKVPDNVRWLDEGRTRAAGDVTVVADRGAIALWDAGYLPGHWVMHEAMRATIDRARQAGIATVVIRRSQHVAAMAPHVLAAAEKGYACWAVVATPSERLVTVHDGISPLFSTNPFAFAFPTDDEPIFMDTSFALTSGSAVKTAWLTGRRLTGAPLIDADGRVSDDPAAFERGALLPLGGLDFGFKGTGLLLWSELFTTAFGGWGRLDDPSDGDANSVFLQVVDPACFGAPERARLQASHLEALFGDVVARPGTAGPRVPGRRALARRREQLANGVELGAHIVSRLAAICAKKGVPFPEGHDTENRT